MQQSFVRSSALGYTLLIFVSLGLAVLEGRLHDIFRFPGWSRTGSNVLIGLLLAISVLLASAAMRGSFRWAKQLECEFRLLLTPIRFDGVVILAIASGIAEETFFRAIMQPAFGLWVTSLTFGLLHYPANRRLIPWTIIATAIGFLFGVVYEATGSLLAVSLAHGLINFIELFNIYRGPDPHLTA